MKLTLLTIFLGFSAINGLAQQINLNDFSGRPIIVPKESFESEGSPYFPEDRFMYAKVFLVNNAYLPRVQIKLNLLTHTWYFLSDKNELLQSTIPTTKVVFEDGTVFESGIKGLDKVPETAFLQLIDTGRCSLLKQIVITYVDSKGYNSNTVVRQFFRQEKFIFRKENSITRIEKIEDILAILSDRRKEISEYVQKNAIRLKKPEDYQKICSFYNHLY